MPPLMHRSPCLSVSLLAVLAFRGCLAQVLFAPPILSPNASSIWTAGSVQSVRWDNGGLDIPPNKHGEVVLGYYDPLDDDPGVGHEYYGQPLADGFLISDEVVNVVVPNDIPSGHYYYILLLGDVRNQSAVFSISNPASPSTSTANLTFPSTIATSSAPSATVSHWSPSGTSTPTSAATTLSSGTMSVTSTDTQTKGTSGGRKVSTDYISSFLLGSMLAILPLLAI
ncbi:hypothetical protein GY45DRAFT_940223 [Cubamyces sp. BRFM 1775]|nr:hypothetical protein GY45DRAFT_940223 [Cubamyces sp. BRFM 1775]